ncbi:hypothetical protein H4S07_003577 [Coemansia furcata]|uniref:Uncharacterized protein n=1 Tax=Coemansia furcata TaxID=417177 RepID=A0ACC1LH76_9FUNG|nr:hypothetical protein H4S07_003577 [Coemansia furcata]
MGHHVIAKTDHHLLHYLKLQKNLSTMLLSWIAIVKDIPIEIMYKPGMENQLADGLSHHPNWEVLAILVMNGNLEMCAKISLGYLKDPDFKAIRHALHEPTMKANKLLTTNIKRYELVDGLLYYVADTHLQLCIPYTDDL